MNRRSFQGGGERGYNLRSNSSGGILHWYEQEEATARETGQRATAQDPCKRQGDSEPCADGKLSHLLVIQTIRMLGPASANSAESENSRLPLPECGSDVQADLRGLPSFVHCRRPASTGQRPGSR